MRWMGTYQCPSSLPGGPHRPGMVLEVKLGYTNARNGNIPVLRRMGCIVDDAKGRQVDYQCSGGPRCPKMALDEEVKAIQMRGMETYQCRGGWDALWMVRKGDRWTTSARGALIIQK